MNVFKKTKNILRWIDNNFVIVLIAFAFLAMAISLSIGLIQSVWFDEAYSVMVAKQPIDSILHLTALDTHPPFYYLLLHVWGGLFGWNDIALRGLSVLCLGGSIYFAGLLIKKMFNTRAALVILPIISLSPFLLRYGFEIRMYALASLIGIAATYVLIRMSEIKDKKQLNNWRIYYVLLVAIGMFTLYYTALLWIAHLSWLIYGSIKRKENFFKTVWLKLYLYSFILYLLWLPVFLHQVSNGALAPISQPMTIDNLVGIISFNFVYQPVWQLTALMSMVIVFVIAALSFLSVRAFKISDDKQKYNLLLLGFYMLIPILILAFVGLFRPMYVERYLAHVTIGGLLYIGAIVYISNIKSSKLIKLCSGAMLAVMLIGLINLIQFGNYNFQRLQKPDIKNASSLMKACADTDSILANDPYVAIELNYYLPKCTINFYSEQAKLGGGYAPLSESSLRIYDIAKQLDGAKNIYYAYYDKSTLQMPLEFKSVSKQAFGPLNVEKFSK